MGDVVCTSVVWINGNDITAHFDDGYVVKMRMTSKGVVAFDSAEQPELTKRFKALEAAWDSVLTFPNKASNTVVEVDKSNVVQRKDGSVLVDIGDDVVIEMNKGDDK